jgi:hypothetical protein
MQLSKFLVSLFQHYSRLLTREAFDAECGRVLSRRHKRQTTITTARCPVKGAGNQYISNNSQYNYRMTAKTIAIASMYNVNSKTIRDIWSGRSWFKATLSQRKEVSLQNLLKMPSLHLPTTNGSFVGFLLNFIINLLILPHHSGATSSYIFFLYPRMRLWPVPTFE